ncbi:hypothetical protein GR7B_00121 [Vibrio phage vB_VcorM_GR7B]|nr:hypothetical protein GR7B_00121 [Vibrio phage vB_VcorM_GR7B]
MDKTIVALAEETFTYVKSTVDISLVEKLADEGDFGFLEALVNTDRDKLHVAGKLLPQYLSKARDLMKPKSTFTTHTRPTLVRNFLASYFMWKAVEEDLDVEVVNRRLPDGMNIEELIRQDLERATLEFRLGVLIHRGNVGTWEEVFHELSN